jgi:GNAT superfamily N-acetyltransferase
MVLRPATRNDLPAIVALLVHEDEPRRSADVGPGHETAFAAIEADPRNELLVSEEAGEVVACVQITYIPGMGRGGGERAQLEGVRVRADRRGGGRGTALMRAAIARARARGCSLVQLSSNARRADAHRFYAALGFTRSHEGFKLDL